MTVFGESAAITTLSPAEMMKLAAARPAELIERLIPQAAVCTLAGAPGIGKSMIGLSLAAAIGCGEDWFGLKVANAYGVLYVLGEGFSAFGNRIDAWRRAKGAEMPEHVRFFDGAAAGVDLSDAASINKLIELTLQSKAALVIFDTFAMLSDVKSENDNAEVGQVYRQLQRFTRATAATALVVHHVSKAEGRVRGATAFRGNSDTVIKVSEDEVQGKERSLLSLSTFTSDDGKQRDLQPIRMVGFEIAAPGVLINEVIERQQSVVHNLLDTAMQKEEETERKVA